MKLHVKCQSQDFLIVSLLLLFYFESIFRNIAKSASVLSTVRTVKQKIIQTRRYSDEACVQSETWLLLMQQVHSAHSAVMKFPESGLVSGSVLFCSSNMFQD